MPVSINGSGSITGVSSLTQLTKLGVTGILTATDFSGPSGGAADFPNGLTATTASFSSNLSVGGNLTIDGVLTYDDVTNIDSVGVVTARDGIDITSGDIVLNKSRSDTHASLIIDKPDAGSGTIKFYNNGSDSGYIQHTNAENLHYYLPSGSGNHVFYTNGANVRLSVTNTGASVTGNLNISGHTYLNDDREIVIGAGQDLKLYHDSATGDSFIKETGSGNLKLVTSTFRVRNAADSEHIIWANQDAEVRLYHDSVKKFETTSGGVTVTGTLIATANVEAQNNFQLLDSKKLLVGNANDLQIYHNGSNNYIDNTSDLYVRVNGSETAIYATANGKYH